MLRPKPELLKLAQASNPAKWSLSPPALSPAWTKLAAAAAFPNISILKYSLIYHSGFLKADNVDLLCQNKCIYQYFVQMISDSEYNIKHNSLINRLDMIVYWFVVNLSVDFYIISFRLI